MAFSPIPYDTLVSVTVSIGTLVGVLLLAIQPHLNALIKHDHLPSFLRPKKREVPAIVKDASKKSSFVDRMINSRKTMAVFYGSQTGTAEDFAQRIARQARHYGISALVCNPDECNMEDVSGLVSIDQHIALFLLASYGDGGPTDNAKGLNSWLHRNQSDLKNLNYAVFGLGNKTYKHFNGFGIYADQRLNEMGGTRLCAMGLGDDSGRMEDDFISWTTTFWETVCLKYELKMQTHIEPIRQYKLVRGPFDTENVFTGEIGRLKCNQIQKAPFHRRNPYLASIKTSRELFHSDSSRSCLHIEFDLADSRLKYEAGDHLVVLPSNDQVLVNRIGQLLDVDLDDIISLVNTDEEAQKRTPFPCPCSYRTALTHYLDITGLPSVQLLKDLTQYATDDSERALLTLMSSFALEGKIAYQQWIRESARSVIAILEDLPSLKPPLDHLCELLPRLQPRYYSISSSPKVHPTSVHITAGIVQYQTSTQRTVNGVATHGFRQAHLQQNADPATPPSHRFPIYIRKSTFRLPANTETPVIMIGPGTGLAPFRGFIQERHECKSQGQAIGEPILYFGCRHRSEDYLYEDELNAYVEQKSLQLHVAFSRDQHDKSYVTHLLKRDAKKLWQWIRHENASIYVCGDAKRMARDVHAILMDTAQSYGEMTSEQATQFFQELTDSRRYAQDVWA